jgi:hypothetical protein
MESKKWKTRARRLRCTFREICVETDYSNEVSNIEKSSEIRNSLKLKAYEFSQIEVISTSNVHW